MRENIFSILETWTSMAVESFRFSECHIQRSDVRQHLSLSQLSRRCSVQLLKSWRRSSTDCHCHHHLYHILPTLLDLHLTSPELGHVQKKIISDPSHSCHHLFQLFPSGKCFSQLRIKGGRQQKSCICPVLSHSWTTEHKKNIAQIFFLCFTFVLVSCTQLLLTHLL